MHLVCWITGPSDYRGIELKVCLRESRDTKIRNKPLIVSSKSESHWLFIAVFCCCFFKTCFLTSWQNFTSWFIQGWLKPLHVIFDGTDDSIFRMLVSSLQLVSCLLLLIYIYMYICTLSVTMFKDIIFFGWNFIRWKEFNIKFYGTVNIL